MSAQPQLGLFEAATSVCTVVQDNRTNRRKTIRSESRAAHDQVKHAKAAVQEQILEYARTQGERGVTADEVIEAFQCSSNHVAPRITEMRKDGRLIATSRRRKTRSNCTARVLVASSCLEMPA